MKSPNAREDIADILEQLESLSVRSLREISQRADALIASKENAEKQQALDEIKLLIEQRGLSGEEVRKHIFPPKYIHPDDDSKTWSGKGKTAIWLQTEIDNGKQLQDFLNPAWKEDQAD